MKKRIVITVVIIALATVTAVIFRQNTRPKLNFLFITLDTTRADRLSCYGYPQRLTPALDSISAKGTLFEYAYTCVPVTLPSHATMFTGLYPPEHGIRVNGKNGLATNVATLAEILSVKGYTNAAFVASSVMSACYGLNKGFHVYDDVDELGANIKTQRHRVMIDHDEQDMPYRPGNEIADSAIKWLAQVTGDPKRKEPFFCWTHFYDPHFPGHWHEDVFGTNRFGHMYDAEVAFMDMQVGRILNFLEEKDLRKNTVIIAVGDHGEGLGDHGENMHGFMLYSTLHVPLIISMPDSMSGNRVGSIVSLRDLFPTILDLLKINPEIYARKDVRNHLLAECMERSFAGAVTGNKIESKPCYAETDMLYVNFQWSPLRCVITPDWKYIRAPRVELYDHQNDPDDLVDLAAESRERVLEMDDLLSEMENKMISGVGAEIQLSEEQKRALASLGYVAGGGSMESPGVRKDLPDIKDMTVCLDKQTDVGIAMRRGERGDEVLAACREIIAMSPGTAKFHTWEGMILSGQKKFDEAMLSFNRACELAPDEFTTYNNLAAALIEQGKLQEAIANFEKALDLNPINDPVKYNLAIACNEYGHTVGSAGNLEESVEYLRRAVELSPDMLVARHNLGVAYLNMGKLRDAIAEFEKVLTQDPEYALAKRGLETARRLLNADNARNGQRGKR